MVAEVAGEKFELYPQRGVHWQAQQALLLADLHLGKVNHFRRSGIPVPHAVNNKNIELLIDLINITCPSRVICLGDLFHSHYNLEWEVFGEVVKHFPEVSFELVLGNHDILSNVQYERKGIKIHEQLRLGPFLFTHHPQEISDSECYNLAGHIHPGVRLSGKGRQAVTLPCFYFGERQGFLPAFGTFTGMARIRMQKEDQVFVIAENKIISVS